MTHPRRILLVAALTVTIAVLSALGSPADAATDPLTAIDAAADRPATAPVRVAVLDWWDGDHAAHGPGTAAAVTRACPSCDIVRVDAYDYPAAAAADADIVTMSYTGPPDGHVCAQLQDIADTGAALVAAASQTPYGQPPPSAPAHPAACPAVTSVSALDTLGQLDRQSARGADLTAPSVFGVDLDGSGQLHLQSGTSASTALTAGIVGQIAAAGHPPAAALAAVVDTATGPDRTVDVGAAWAHLTPPAPPLPAPPPLPLIGPQPDGCRPLPWLAETAVRAVPWRLLHR